MFSLKKVIPQTDNLREVIETQFNDFVNSDRERLVLDIKELSEEDAKFYQDQVPKGWRTFEQGQHAYYPQENLESREKMMINAERNYQIVSFVKPRAFACAPYEQPGVEIVSRVRSNALLPKMVPESNLNYSSIKNFFPQSALENFVQASKEAKVTVQDINAGVLCGKVSYEEMNAWHCDVALNKLQQRNEKADEHLFRDMRTNIANAKYSNK